MVGNTFELISRSGCCWGWVKEGGVYTESAGEAVTGPVAGEEVAVFISFRGQISCTRGEIRTDDPPGSSIVLMDSVFTCVRVCVLASSHTS